MVVVRLGADNALLAWSKTPVPALMNLAELAHASAFAGVDRELILYDNSAPRPTMLERADGNWEAVARRHELNFFASVFHFFATFFQVHSFAASPSFFDICFPLHQSLP
jgi:hypothetical protein